jgi:hypothetical protein
MPGDYTRFTFRPEQDHSTVLMQQGRVQVDADWNELAEIVYRRIRAETVDIMGCCAVPRDQCAPPGTMPTGFQILAAGGSYTIGIGRAYVDGLLAENRGALPLTGLEPRWGEPIGTTPTPYKDQPYLVGVTDPTGPGPHVFYLDVWDREVTAVEDSGFVDPAVGVDTTTRLQAVWQVKTLKVPAGTMCASDWNTVKAWVELTTPSGARLTTTDVGTPASTDPCLVLPSGGYRGIDNRLYRIEVHDDGTQGPATIKWSRSNASVAARLTGPIGGSAAAPVVPVETIGKDAILRFHAGEWIELIDRTRELDGTPGIMAKIAPNGVDATRLELKLEGVSAPVFTQLTGLGAEPRARRWETRPGDASALIPFTPGTPIDLEDGVRVTVDVVAPGVPHTGDYWVFTARSADATVERLTKAPPRGIRHHYCRLAVVTGDAIEDCRVIYPPECPEPVVEEGCDCDVCVTPESHEDGSLTIQDAIDKVRDTGGKVCLHAGVFVLGKPVLIAGAHSIQLVGKGLATILYMRGDGPAIDVYRSVEVTLEHLAVATDRQGGDARTPEIGIAVRGAAGVTVQRCFITMAAGFRTDAVMVAMARPQFQPQEVGGGSSAGAFAQPSGSASLARGAIGIGLSGLLVMTVLRENVILSEIGIGTLTTDRASTWEPGRTIGAERFAVFSKAALKTSYKGVTKLTDSVYTWGLFIEDNVLPCSRVGVDLGRSGRTKGPAPKVKALATDVIVHLGDTRIAGNTISGCVEACIVASGMVVSDPGALGSLIRAVPAKATAAALADAGAAAVGLLGIAPMLGSGVMAAAGARLDILGNMLSPVGHGIVVGCDDTRIEDNDIAGQEETGVPSNGIFLLRGASQTTRHALVVGNRITGLEGHGIALDTWIESGLIKLNVVQSVGGAGIACLERAGFTTLTVENNQVLEVGMSEDEAVFARAGIVVAGGSHADVTGNTVAGVGLVSVRKPSIRAGVLALGIRSARVRGNSVDGVGADGEFLGAASGIAADGEVERLDVSDNEVNVFGARESRATALELGIPAQGNSVLGSLSLVGTAWTQASDFPPSVRNWYEVEADERVFSVHGNHLQSDGRTPAVLVTTGGSCHFADNRVTRQSPGELIGELRAAAGAVVTSNIFSALDTQLFTIDVGSPALGAPPPATVVGNLGPREIVLNGGPLTPPWDVLNVPR